MNGLQRLEEVLVEAVEHHRRASLDADPVADHELGEAAAVDRSILAFTRSASVVAPLMKLLVVRG